MAIKTLKICFVFFILIPSFFSCTPQKNYIYLQDKGNNSGTVSDKNISFVYKIKPKDVLYIKTVPIDEESSLSLNANTQTNAYSTELGAYLNSFSVNDSGFVELPMIGKINVKGLTIEESQKVIQEKVDYYLKNSLVIVKLLNFNITILGEVNKPGTFKVYNTQLNILEAIGLAGDLTMNGNRKQISLIRQNNPEKVIPIDITDKNLLQSEYFYLLPNDVIYVKPRANASKLIQIL
ncbi:MAG TPA: polysaccharide biosynthesis/export family protein [Bacteroidales bacterium]|nr:polysaccharide biosynthesis/export family protein [Bacteroidales bacterium]HPS18267.1 polysaccharide biosynthesis/export family protein [Bacteroidales bacterium]